ncbi:anthranilate synthase component II [Thermovirga lienii]|uniref:anthranilate synthase component II n=1 Tax=Thermovirga lienii TaxID=336261 RepID=UPI00074785D9|nr:MAG: Glutamine amidotransferase of anthranilate synthase [Thermovirga lienii]MDN5319514.1 anthranilate synthase component [Thermovirga sp.]
MILVIDNYDSFTYNLVQYLSLIDTVRTYRNDEIQCEEIKDIQPDGIVISPGPGTPDESGISKEVIRAFAGVIPILGVCLGHQAIAEVFGGRVIRGEVPFHGKTSEIYHRGEGVLEGLPSPFRATRYHSLVVEETSLPRELKVVATTLDGTIMAIQHTSFPVYGVQFHPESIMTDHGEKILRNFHKIAKEHLRRGVEQR